VIERAGGHEVEAVASSLAPVLIDTGEGGASVGWIEPPTPAEAELWWSELLAAAEGLTLLVLDRHTGSLAESLYRGWGWQAVGVIPDFAVSPDGTLGGTTVKFKRL
jgi:hypothetical protein